MDATAGGMMAEIELEMSLTLRPLLRRLEAAVGVQDLRRVELLLAIERGYLALARSRELRASGWGFGDLS